MWYIVVDHWNGIHFALTHVNKLAFSFSSVSCSSLRIRFRNWSLLRMRRRSLTFRPQWLNSSIMHADWICQSATPSHEKHTRRWHRCSNFMTWWIYPEGLNWKSKESGITYSRYVILYGCWYEFFSGCLIGKWTANSKFEAKPRATRITIGISGNPLRASHGNTRDGQGALCNAEFVRQHKGHDSGTYLHSNQIANCKINVSRCKIHGRRI